MRVTVHQTLHGYADGHRLLGSSINLSPNDARLMLVMSDASGPGVTTLSNVYFTGYPLAESGLYVIASTWAAPEMSRPGCVWTHSVLISFSDLARMDAPSVLVEMMKQPDAQAVADYATEVEVEVGQGRRPPLTKSTREFASVLAKALYEHPDKQVWVRPSSDAAHIDVVLRLWDQQWPKLRRNFKFCTLTTKDRSIDELQFDLQLTPSRGSNVRLRFATPGDDIEAVDASNAAWVEALIDDLDEPRTRPLKQFLRQAGTEMLGGREAMRSMATLHALLNSENTKLEPDAVSIATVLVREDPQLTQSRTAKAAVVLAALSVGLFVRLSEEVLDFVLVHFELLRESEGQENASLLSRVVWRTDPRAFIVATYEGSKEVQAALRDGVVSLDKEAVFEVLPKFADLAEPLLHLLPSLADDKRFWALTQSWPSSVAALGVDVKSPAALHAMVTGLHDLGAINSALHVIGTQPLLSCLEELLRRNIAVEGIPNWVRQACNDVSGIAQFLAHSRQSPELLIRLAASLAPDAIPNDYGDDPWCVALYNLSSSSGPLPIELCAYGFRRSMSWRSRSVTSLLQLTFEPLHQAAVRQAIPSESWNLLESALSWMPSNESWDNGLRLRRAVAKKCVDFPVHPVGFVSLVASEELLNDLMDAVWQLWNGPRYLKSVKAWLEDEPDQAFARSRELVRSFVKERSKFWR